MLCDTSAHARNKIIRMYSIIDEIVIYRTKYIWGSFYNNPINCSIKHNFKMNKNVEYKLKGEQIVVEFLESKKNANCLLKLEELLLSPDEECILVTFQAVLDLFSKVFSAGMLSLSSPIDDKSADYKLWLLGRYEDFISHILSYLSHSSQDVQSSALQTLLALVRLESEFPRKNEKDNLNFPFSLFKKIVSSLASNVFNQHNLIKVFQGYTKYHDVKLYLLKAVDSLLRECQEITAMFLQNCFLLLYSIKFPKKFDGTIETFAYQLDSLQLSELKEKPFRKLFSSVWKCLLSYELSPDFLQKALCALSENVLPHLHNPYLMTDFLTNSYNKGGVLSLLALKGLYILMDRYNLEYPDFFVKLYALLDKDIINGKFSSKFFDLTALFLSSIHLPAHIVAAFAKKLSRLSLISKADNILKILCLVSNLMTNHPSLGVLIHNMDGEESERDPFRMDAADPAKSHAMKSSLFEIKMLQYHVNPDVSCKAKELISAYPKFSTDISEISSTSLWDLYTKLRKRKFKEVPLAIHRPTKRSRSDDS